MEHHERPFTHAGTLTHPAESKGWTKPRPYNAIWELSPGRWAIGVHKILERLQEDSPLPGDAEAVWIDFDQVRFCIRPRPADMGPDFNPATVLEVLRSPDNVGIVRNFTMGVWRISKGVIVKSKWLGTNGRPGEAAALQTIRKQAPSVPVPRVYHHWEDSDWFCYFTIMSEVQGMDLYTVWCDLEQEHRDRLAKEIAYHMKTVGDITSEYAVYPDGAPLDGWAELGTGDETINNEDIKTTPGRGPFTAQGLLERLRTEVLRPGETLPSSWGTQLHLCHMDLKPEHFFVSDGRPSPPYDKRRLIKLSPERQADLRVVGIIDWERAAFYPRTMVTYQYVYWAGSDAWKEAGWSAEEMWDHGVSRSVLREMIALGCDHPRDSPLRVIFPSSDENLDYDVKAKDLPEDSSTKAFLKMLEDENRARISKDKIDSSISKHST